MEYLKNPLEYSIYSIDTPKKLRAAKIYSTIGTYSISGVFHIRGTYCNLSGPCDCKLIGVDYCMSLGLTTAPSGMALREAIDLFPGLQVDPLFTIVPEYIL